MSLQIPPQPIPRPPEQAPQPRPVEVPVSAAMRESGQVSSIAGLILCGVALAAAAALGSVPLWLGVAGALCAACLLGGLVELMRAAVAARREGRETREYADRVSRNPQLLTAWREQPDQGQRQGLEFWRQVMAVRADLLPYAPAWVRDSHADQCEAALAARPERWMWVRDQRHVALDANDPLVQGALRSLEQLRTAGETLSADEWAELARRPHPLVVAQPELAHALVALPMPRNPDAMNSWLRFWRVHAQVLGLPILAEAQSSDHHFAVAAAGWLNAIAQQQIPADLARDALGLIRQRLIHGPNPELVLHLRGSAGLRTLQGQNQASNPTSIRIDGRSSHVAESSPAKEQVREEQEPFAQQEVAWAVLGLQALAQTEHLSDSHWTWEQAWEFATESLEREAAEPAEGQLDPTQARLIREAIRVVRDELARGELRQHHLGCVPACVLEQPELRETLMQALHAFPERIWELPRTISEGLAGEMLGRAMDYVRETRAETPENVSPPECIGLYPRLVETWMEQFPEALRDTEFWFNSPPARSGLIAIIARNPELWETLPLHVRFANDLLSVWIPEGVHSLRNIGAPRPDEAAQSAVLQLPTMQLPPDEAQRADRIRERVLRSCGERWRLQREAGEITEQQCLDFEQQAWWFRSGGLGMTLDGLRAIWSAVGLDGVLDAVREECADHVEQFDSTVSAGSEASSSSSRLTDERALRLAITLGVLAEV
jgi:hypothetical protein